MNKLLIILLLGLLSCSHFKDRPIMGIDSNQYKCKVGDRVMYSGDNQQVIEFLANNKCWRTGTVTKCTKKYVEIKFSSSFFKYNTICFIIANKNEIEGE